MISKGRIKQILFVAGLILLIPVLNSSADIYKCVSEDGVLTFSDEPCDSKAEVAFKTEEYDFDKAIGNGSPYPEQPVPPSKIWREDFKAHAKKIGKTILPYEYNNSVVDKTSPLMPGWYIDLYFGSETNKKNYEISLHYGRNPSNKGVYVWLHSIVIKKDGKPYDPPSMVNVKTYKKMGSGRWEIK